MIRYRLRTLLIVGALGPPAIGLLWYGWQEEIPAIMIFSVAVAASLVSTMVGTLLFFWRLDWRIVVGAAVMSIGWSYFGQRCLLLARCGVALLSHAILAAGLFHPIDTRFNSVLYETLLVHHQFLFTQPLGEHVTRAIIRAELAKNFFLHFAYDQRLMRFLADS